MPGSPASARFGYTLSSEEHAPRVLIDNARAAESAGFDFVSISDHYHPWIDRQGHSPFVWSVIGGIAATTERITVGTGVTCPTVRIHPAVLAQAAATAGCLLPGRFAFGVGTGEKLNEHITGARWPEFEVRADMLDEAIEVIRSLWSGSVTSHHGRHFTVENARIYDVPDPLPPIVVAASGPKSAGLAASAGDGLWLSSVDAETITAWRDAGGSGPVYCQVGICWGGSEDACARTVAEVWPNAAVHGQVSQELPSPAHFAELLAGVTPEQVKGSIPCGPDVSRIAESVTQAIEAGVTDVYLHQIGPEQASFLEMARSELLPMLRGS